MMLRKLSKTVKQLAETDSAYAPWPLKGQIDYNISPVNIYLFSLRVTSNTMPTISSLTFSQPSMTTFQKRATNLSTRS